jgi:hypothetical protein
MNISAADCGHTHVAAELLFYFVQVIRLAPPPDASFIKAMLVRPLNWRRPEFAGFERNVVRGIYPDGDFKKTGRVDSRIGLPKPLNEGRRSQPTQAGKARVWRTGA